MAVLLLKEKKTRSRDTSEVENPKDFPHLRGTALLSERLPSIFSRSSDMTKFSVIPGCRVFASRARLGQKLHQPTVDFNLWDPNGQVTNFGYNSLHDPCLSKYHHQRKMHEKLKRQNFITEEDRVVCSVKEYITYNRYLDMVKSDLDKTYGEKMREKMMSFVKLQEGGHIPRSIALAELREYLLKIGTHGLNDLRLSSGPCDIRLKYVLEAGCCTQREHALYKHLYKENWISKARFQMMMIEKDLRAEVNKASYLKDVKQRCNNKKKTITEQKLAMEKRRMEEMMNRLQYERMRAGSVTPNLLLQQTLKTPELAPVCHQAALPPVKIKVSLAAESSMAKRLLPKRQRIRRPTTMDKALKTQQTPSLCQPSEATAGDSAPGSDTQTKTVKGHAASGGSRSSKSKTSAPSTASKSTLTTSSEVAEKHHVGGKEAEQRQGFVPEAPSVQKTDKPTTVTQSITKVDRDIIAHAALDDLGNSSVKEESSEFGVILKDSEFPQTLKRPQSSRMASEMLRCASHVTSTPKFSDEAVQWLSGREGFPKASGQMDGDYELDGATDNMPNAYVANVITDVLEIVKEQVNIEQGHSPELWAGSRVASHTALDAVTGIFDDVKECVIQESSVIEAVMGQVIEKKEEVRLPELRAVSRVASQTTLDVVSSILDDVNDCVIQESSVMELVKEQVLENIEQACLLKRGADSQGASQTAFDMMTGSISEGVGHPLCNSNFEAGIARYESRETAPADIQEVYSKLDLINTVYNNLLYTEEAAEYKEQWGKIVSPDGNYVMIPAQSGDRAAGLPVMNLDSLSSLSSESFLMTNSKSGEMVSFDTSFVSENNREMKSEFEVSVSSQHGVSSYDPGTLDTLQPEKEIPYPPITSDSSMIVVVPAADATEVVSTPATTRIKPILPLDKVNFTGENSEKKIPSAHDLKKVSPEARPPASVPLPNAYAFLVDGVADHLGTEPFQCRLTQSVKNQVKNSLSLSELQVLDVQDDDCVDQQMIDDMVKAVSKTVLLGQLSAGNDSTDEETFSMLEMAAVEVVRKVFQTVKEQFVGKMRECSPKIAVLPQVSQTAINAVCGLLDSMDTNLMARSPSTSPVNLELISEEHADERINSPRIEEISNSLVEYVLEMCCGLGESPACVSEGQTKENVDVQTILSEFSGFDRKPLTIHTQNEHASNAPSISESTVKLEVNDFSPPQLVQRTPETASCGKSVDDKRLISLTYCDSKTGSLRQRAYNITKSTPFSHLFATIVNGVLEHIDADPFKDQMVRSVRDGFKCSLSVPEVGMGNLQESEWPEKDMTEELLKCVSAKLSQLSLTCNDQSSHQQWVQSRESETDTGKHDTPPETTDNILDAVETSAKELMVNVLDHVIDKINMVSPKLAVSPTASDTAINAICTILGDMRTSVMESSTQLTDGVTGLQSGSASVTSLDTKAEESEALYRHPGTWTTASKVEDISAGLVETVIEALKDECLVMLEEPSTNSLQKVNVLQKGKSDSVVQTKSSSKGFLPVGGPPLSKCKCQSMSSLEVLEEPSVTPNNRRRSLECLDKLKETALNKSKLYMLYKNRTVSPNESTQTPFSPSSDEDPTTAAGQTKVVLSNLNVGAVHVSDEESDRAVSRKAPVVEITESLRGTDENWPAAKATTGRVCDISSPSALIPRPPAGAVTRRGLARTGSFLRQAYSWHLSPDGL